MSRKSKGCDAERELVHLFWQTNEWAACRVAGSGSIKYPAPDIIAASPTRRFAIECKACKGHYQYFDKEEISDLQRFATITNAEPLVAVRFNNEQWHFISLPDLPQTDKHYVVTRDTIQKIGKLFKDITSRIDR